MNKAKFFLITGIAAFMLYATKLFSANKSNCKNIIIGDSHAVMIGSKLKNVTVENKLAHSGWFVSNVINALIDYPVTTNVCKVFISLGTNGQFSKNDNIESLMTKLVIKFPNAQFYVFKGSYGWSGKYNDPNAASNRYPYYQRFAYYGANILNNGLGYFATDAQAHSTNSPQAQAIINEINSIAQ